MKGKIFVLLLLLFQLVSSFSIEEKRSTFVTNLQNFINRDIDLPSDNEYVLNVVPSSSIIFQSVNIIDIPKIQLRYGLSDGVVSQIKAAQYASNTNIYSKISETISSTLGEYKETIGSAFRDGDTIYFAMIEVTSIADLIAKKVNVCTEECSGWWIFKSCSENCQIEDAGYDADDKIKITQTMKYFSTQSIMRYINELKKPGFQTYISQGKYIMSDDGKTKAYITDFGAIAIGDNEDIRFLEPLKTMKFERPDGTFKTSVQGEVLQSCLIDENNEEKCFIFNKSMPQRINYIGPLNGAYSLEDILKYKDRHQKTSNYALKILNSGNMVLYDGTAVIWQSNSANKGTGPYELFMEDIRELILKDSNGQIVYESGGYKRFNFFQHYELNGYNGLLDYRTIFNSSSEGHLVHTYRIPGMRFGSITEPIYLCEYPGTGTESKPPRRYIVKVDDCGANMQVSQLGYVFTTPGEGRVPIYECDGQSKGGYVTTTIATCEIEGGINRGLLGYVYIEVDIKTIG